MVDQLLDGLPCLAGQAEDGFGVSHGVGGMGELVGAPEQGAGFAQQGGDRFGGPRCGERVGIGHAGDSDAIAHQCPVPADEAPQGSPT